MAGIANNESQYFDVLGLSFARVMDRLARDEAFRSSVAKRQLALVEAVAGRTAFERGLAEALAGLGIRMRDAR